MPVTSLPSRTFPLGATVSPYGVNFSVFSQHCTGMELLLFDHPTDTQPRRIIPFDPVHNKTVNYWHLFVPDIGAGHLYAYRAHGPFQPEKGLRFDSTKVLLDPYAKAIAGWENYNRKAAALPGDNCATALKSVVVDNTTYDWEGDTPLRVPFAKSVIYELHVGGFTKHPSSGIASNLRGTYAGLIEKIPYLKELGITAVELLPIHQFDPEDARPGLTNYWGYSTLGFFAPHWGYSSRKDPLGPVDEFRDMVKALHRAGIEVILDVVYNHSAEGNHEGPTLCFKGIDNPTYYILDRNPFYYSNYTGCGNTIKANHPVVARLILDSLRYWVSEMHVDGFRFDLAAILARGLSGTVLEDPPVLWAMDTDPVLVESKAIAEAWDAAGLYAVGGFIGKSDRFAEWNGPFRDDARRFIKGDDGMVGRLAARILGSPDIYRRPDYGPARSINFITCHDGFTLNDLVSYNHKHNLDNGEDDRDGANDNHSWNCGVEGPTDDPHIEALRLRQIKNLLTLMFLSQGTPMLLMGDEIRRTQRGNNNGYCQDNELSWFDWSLAAQEDDLLRFVKRLIHFSESLEVFCPQGLLEVTLGSENPHLIWHGIYHHRPDWSKQSRTIAFSLRHPSAEEHLHVIFNSYWEALYFELPPIRLEESWHRIIDTSLPAPEDIIDAQDAPIHKPMKYLVEGRSAVVLMVR